jgi:predicted permease
VLRELARNPLVLATLAGLAWNFFGPAFPATGLKILARLGDAAIALGLLAVGAALRLRGVVGPGGRAIAFWIMAVKLLAMPAATLLLTNWLGLTGIYRSVAVIFAALPTASSAYILAQRMGGDGTRVAWLISATTLAAMITLPAWLALIS